MAQWLRQSTAVTVKTGPFVDDTDGVTPETLLIITQADIRLSKNGGNFTQTNNIAGATHDENGYYDVPLDITDTNTKGALRMAISKSGALPVWQDFMVGMLSVSATSVIAVVEGSVITIQRGDTLTAVLTGLGSLIDYVSLDFTIKSNRGDADTAAIIRIRKNASGIGDGLLTLNGMTAPTAIDGSITIDDLALGNITITLIAADTATLSVVSGLYYDVQRITAAGVITLTSGAASVVGDVTRAVV